MMVTADPDLIQQALQKNHRNYDKSEIQANFLLPYLGQGLLTNTGSSWLRQRRLIQPGFHRKRIEALVKAMQIEIEEQCKKLDHAITNNEPVRVEQFTLQLAFRVITRAIFTDGFNEAEMHKLDEDMTSVLKYVVYPIRMPILRPITRAIGLEKRYRNIAHQATERLRKRVQARKRSKRAYEDLLQMLLDSRYEDTGEAMEEQQLLDEIKILFVAGHETSANALAWTLYLLEQHPVYLTKVRKEIMDQLGEGPATAENLRQLTLLTAIIEESMRLYPPAWITDRVALEDDQFAEEIIPKDTIVNLYIYGVHHSSTHYQNPELFRPERMFHVEKKKRHPFAFMPFGAGPRLCIGMHFAMLEMQLTLVHLLRHYEFERTSTNPIPNQPYITLRPKKSIEMFVKRRTSPVQRPISSANLL
ncbi:MAG: cytochrome P450, partial [Bacteroidota bacterium]